MKTPSAAFEVLLKAGYHPDLLTQFLDGVPQAGIDLCHTLARKAGWWNNLETGLYEPRPVEDLLCLALSELYEGFEGYRKDLMDDHLPAYPMVYVELADFMIRMYDMAGGCKWRVQAAEFEKALLWRTEISSYSELVLSMSMNIPRCSTHTLMREGGIENKSAPTEYLYALAYVTKYVEENPEPTGTPLTHIMLEKLAYNYNRADHKREARMAEGGKKF